MNTTNNHLIKELQYLFSQLKLSEQRAVNTKRLTQSFGWKNNQSYEQHDAHELLSLLFENMENNTKELFESKMKGNIYILILFYYNIFKYILNIF